MFISIVTILYAFLEYSNLDPLVKNHHETGTFRLLIRLLTRGYMANFTLLDFRTTRYDTADKKWMDESDEPHLDHKKNLSQQISYYILATIMNIVLIYTWYKFELPQGYFLCEIGRREVCLAVVLTGAPLSLLLTFIFR